ncbi:CU044_2847 family protein [Variovorax sp.]|jgi:hypothetical protein|uniref:CU044_2847 family protein n=1 Tax=Variovorax sp. TaxID=1871043 RepID=UPI0037DA5345
MTAKLERISIGGQEFWVEVAEVESPRQLAETPSTATGSSPKKTDTSNDSQGLVKKISTTDLETLVSRLVGPAREALTKAGQFKECSVELSLGLKGEVGFFLAKGEANVALKISVKW